MECVLVTGASGFLGSHIIESLIKLDYKVVVLKRPASNLWRIEHLLNQLEVHDIGRQTVKSVFRQHEIDIVIHTACDYGRQNNSLESVINGNLMFGLQVLESAAESSTSLFINTGTSLPPEINAYSLSKKQFSEWLKFYSKKIKCINLKMDHMYGPKDDNSKFIFWLLDQMIHSNDDIDLTTGEQLRNFVYIDDVVSAYLHMLKISSDLHEWNEFDISVNDSILVKDFVLSLKESLEKHLKKDIKARLNFGAILYREGEVMIPDVNNAPLLATGWKPEVGLEFGLSNIIKESL